MTEKKRLDGRKHNETREIKAEVDIIKNADGSAMFAFGDTIALAAVYGPRVLHPQHMQNPQKGILRCNYNMLSFSVSERIRPGLSRRGQEISKVIEWAFSPVIDLEQFPNTVVDLYIEILQANASTRCAAINAASMALAQAGLPMKEMVSSISLGKINGEIVADLTKDEEDVENATDFPIAMTSRSKKISLMQLDGEVGKQDIKKAIELAKETLSKVYAEQEKALKKTSEGKNE
jgi:exosome complex component RRP41